MNCSSALVNNKKKKKKKEKSYSKGKKGLSLEEFGMMEINIAGYIERHGIELSQIRKWTTVPIAMCITGTRIYVVCVFPTHIYTIIYTYIII